MIKDQSTCCNMNCISMINARLLLLIVGVQVGIDPVIAQQREDALRGEAFQVVSQLQGSVQHAQQVVQAVQSEANATVQETQAQAREWLGKQQCM